jgi:hypothetical protein
MQESNRYVEYDWDTIKKSSHWEAFSRGWDAATVNVNGWEDAYKMGVEAGKELEQREWQELTMEELDALVEEHSGWPVEMVGHVLICAAEDKLKEKNT